MSNQTLIFFSLLIIFCMAALFAVQLLPTFMAVETETYVTYNGTKGMAVKQNNKEWTLNFDQQNLFIASINGGEHIGKQLIRENPEIFPYQSVTVYQFDKPNITFRSVALQDDQIVFAAPEVIENGYLIEGSEGKLKAMLSEAFDRD